eukprot:6205850-Pleurochrysis_carterae.AAC.2
MRAVSWSRDICPAPYRQQLGLNCDRSLCVILHTNFEADASEPHNHFDAVSFPNAYLMLSSLYF